MLVFGPVQFYKMFLVGNQPNSSSTHKMVGATLHITKHFTDLSLSPKELDHSITKLLNINGLYI